MSSFRNLYIYFALLIPATVLAFATSFFAGKTFSGKSLTVVLNVHAALMVLWLLMLMRRHGSFEPSATGCIGGWVVRRM